MSTNRLRIKFSKIALIYNNIQQNVHIPGYTARSQSNYDKYRNVRLANPVKRNFHDSWFKNRTSLHYDEAKDLTFCMVAYKDGKLNSNNLDKAFIINGFSN